MEKVAAENSDGPKTVITGTAFLTRHASIKKFVANFKKIMHMCTINSFIQATHLTLKT